MLPITLFKRILFSRKCPITDRLFQLSQILQLQKNCYFYSSMFFEGPNDLKVNQLQEQLQLLNQRMDQLAQQGNYILAESVRVNAQELKTELDSKRKQVLNHQQKQDGKDVRKFLKEELANFQKEWTSRMDEQKVKAEGMRSVLRQKQIKEFEKEKEKLEEEIPVKGKDSSELLSLRIAEENLAKQQNYKEALLVQKKVKELENKEAQEWNKAREVKLEKEMKSFKAKQLIQTKGMQKKINSQVWELGLQRTKTEAQLVLKHSVIKQELKSHNKKENLMASGEMKSRIDVLSPSKSRILSPTQSRMLSPRNKMLSASWSQKLLSTMTR